MSDWAYRDCPCGDRVHMNCFCKCGSDPWNIIRKRDKRVSELLEKKANLQKQVDEIDHFIAEERKVRNPYEKLVQEKQSENINIPDTAGIVPNGLYSNRMLLVKSLFYYGTDFNNKGHYFWGFSGDGLKRSNISVAEPCGAEHLGIHRIGGLPFDPEKYPKDKNLKLGSVEYHYEYGYSILVIEGSVSDKRPQSKSVFFINKQVEKEELINIIGLTTAGKKILSFFSTIIVIS